MPDIDRKSRLRRRKAAIRHALITVPAARMRSRSASKPRFTLNQRRVLLPGLPASLQGLRITHFSDLHIGELIRPQELGAIVDAANSLKGDLIAVTGDFIDFSTTHLQAVVDGLKELKAPLGLWCVLGNHDHLQDGAAVRAAFAGAGLNLLSDSAVRLDHLGRTIGVAGIDWTHKAREIPGAVEKAWRKMGYCDLTVLLAHHPHAFDAAWHHGIQLTLAGHTHGGQIRLTRGGPQRGGISPARLRYRYTHGLYEKGSSRLHVSSGIGAWFPLRFRCPAEMTCLELHQGDK